jgi:CRP/FNR family transcriptional regulator, nitrogen fixation regulation protein
MVSTFLGFAAKSTSQGPSSESRRRLRSGRRFVLAAPRPQGARIRNILFSEGDQADEVFEVLKGTVVVSRSLAGGRRQIIDVVGPGRMVGFTARPTHECSAIALASTELIAFDRFSAQNWNDEDLDFDSAVLREIDRLRRLVSLLGRKTAIERLATFLADLLGEHEGPQVVALLLSRQEIADHLGLAVETVSRCFLTLKRRGVIKRAGRTSVTILDCSALRSIGACDRDTIT